MAGDRCYRGLQRYGTVILRDITGREKAEQQAVENWQTEKQN